MYYTYMLRCKDNSIYTGITTDVERRFKEHQNKERKKSKYTAVHEASKIEAVWQSDTKQDACKLEYHIKRLTKKQKEELIKDNNNLVVFLKDKIVEKQFERFNEYNINKFNTNTLNLI